MELLDRLLRPKGLPRAHCTISVDGVKLGFGRRRVPLDEVDRFEIERFDPDFDDADWGPHLERFWPGRTRRRDEPHEHLVLLTRTGETFRIGTSEWESLGNVAVQLNNQLNGFKPAAQPEDDGTGPGAASG